MLLSMVVDLVIGSLQAAVGDAGPRVSPEHPTARCDPWASARQPAAMTSEEIVRLTREHTFFSWSVQGADRPDRDRPGRGRLPLHARGPADPRLQQPADVGQHRPRRPARHRRHHRAGDEAPVRPAGVRHGDPGAPRREARRDPARRPGQGVLHARRRRGDRERDQARPRVHAAATRSSPATAPTTARRSGR